MNELIDSLNRNAGALSAIFSLVVSIATVFYVLLTGKLVSETRRLRQTQSDPHIAVRVESHESYIHIIMLVVENIGPGPAYNVTLEVNPDIELDPGSPLSEMGIFKYGMKYMAPGQKVKTFLTSVLGQIDEIKSPNGKLRFSVTVTYHNLNSVVFHRTYPIDFLHLVGMSTIGKPPIQSIADELEKLQKAVDKLQSGWSRLKVDVHTHADRSREKKEHAKRRKAMIAANQPKTKEDSSRESS